MKSDKIVASTLMAILGLYVFSYLVWINYTATGSYFKGILGQHAIHIGMSFAMNPSPPILLKIYWPLMLLDGMSGRLSISVG